MAALLPYGVPLGRPRLPWGSALARHDGLVVQWTLKEAARECGVSVDTVKRRLPELREAGAHKSASGAWQVTPQQLMAVGLQPGKPSAPDAPSAAAVQPQGTAPGHADSALAQRVQELEQQLAAERTSLAVERARREAAEAIAAERQRSLDRADLALRMLEAKPAPMPSAPVQEEPAPAPAESKPAAEAAPAATAGESPAEAPSRSQRGWLRWLRPG